MNIRRPGTREVIEKVELRNGALFWKETGTPIHMSRHARGYRQFSIRGFWFLEHRVLWLLTYSKWPSYCIDHINGVTSDNRLENLRDVPLSANSRNRKLHSNNTSGAMGVYFYKPRQKWRAKVRIGGHDRVLGDFVSLDEAIAARRKVEAELGFSRTTERAA